MSGAKPIRPSEVDALKRDTFPAAVFEAFNELIAREYSGGSAVVFQDDAVKLIADKLSINTTDVFKLGYLNIEGVYRNAGWRVEYDSPGYNESYRANYRFTAAESPARERP